MTATERLTVLGVILAGGITWNLTLDVHAQPGPSRVAPPSADAPASTAENPMATPRPRPDGRFRVLLDDGSMVYGKLSTKDTWKMKSALGDVSVPLEKLVSLEIQGEPKSAKVTLRNGDRITGELALTHLKVEAKWAELSIDPKHIKSMISSEYVSGYHMIRRAVSVRDAEGNVRVHFIEEVVPGSASPYTPSPTGGFYSYPSQAAPPTLTPASPYAPAPVPVPAPLAPATSTLPRAPTPVYPGAAIVPAG